MIDKLTRKIKVLEREMEKLKQEHRKDRSTLISIIKEVVSWHTHLPNGEMGWAIPKELTQAQREILEKKLKEKLGSLNLEEEIQTNDNLIIKMTPADEVNAH